MEKNEFGKHLERLKLKIKQLDDLCDELEKLILKRIGQENRQWLSALQSGRLDIEEIKSTGESMLNKYKELLEKEQVIREKDSIRKLEKIEKEKKKFFDSIDDILEICKLLEDNLRITLSQI